MKKYVFYVGDEDDLYYYDFWDNERGKENQKITVEDNYFSAIKCIHDKRVAIVIEGEMGTKCPVEAYKYEGEANNHELIKYIDPTPYLGDMLEDGDLEEVK